MGGTRIREGDHIPLDANTDTIYLQEVAIIVARIADERFQNVQHEIIGVIDSLIADSLDGS